MSHSRRCHTMPFPVLHTKAASLSAGTVLGAAATAVSSLHRQAKLPSNTDLLVGYRRCFSPEQTLPVPFLSALSVPPVRFSIPELSPFHSAVAAEAESGCQDPLLLFDSCFFFPLSVFYSQGS